MKKRTLKIEYLILFLFIFIGLNACKKHHHSSNNNDKNDSIADWRDADSLKYYIWHINVSDEDKPIPYLKNYVFGWVPMYYWADDVPDDLSWSDEKYNGTTLGETGTNLMNSIASYSPKFNGSPKDRYSFIDVQGSISQELQDGVKGDYGYMFGFAQDPDGNIHTLIEYVYPGSPAATQGIKRGDEITAINGNSDLNSGTQSGRQEIVKELLQSKSVQLKLIKPDNTDYSVNLDKADYHLNPVLFHHIYTVGGKKVGYFVYNTFVAVGSEGNSSRAKEEIDTVFAKFKSAGVKELIVDLRYNGGGSVASTEYLDNLIAPASAVGKEMYQYKYNAELTSFLNDQEKDVKNSFLAPIKFQKVDNNLDLNRVFFIGSRETASAAELTINNLKPYMDVQLVGDTTYGKPVGFFTIPIKYVTRNDGYQHVADMYAINFKSINSEGVSDYYDGLDPNFEFPGYLGFRWGKNDPVIKSIFHKISDGSYLNVDEILRKQNTMARKVPQPQRAKSLMRKSSSLKIHHTGQFNGMVDYQRSKDLRLHLK